MVAFFAGAIDDVSGEIAALAAAFGDINVNLNVVHAWQQQLSLLSLVCFIISVATAAVCWHHCFGCDLTLTFQRVGRIGIANLLV